VTLYVAEDINLLSDQWVCDPQSFSQVYCFVSALGVGMTLRFTKFDFDLLQNYLFREEMVDYHASCPVLRPRKLV